MLFEGNTPQVLIYSKPIDMRKSIGGLSIVVADHLGLNPTSGTLFVFYNKRHDKMKILYWQMNGYCLFYKRLEGDLFVIPKGVDETIVLTHQQLRWLLDGLDITKVKGHLKKSYSLHC